MSISSCPFAKDEQKGYSECLRETCAIWDGAEKRCAIAMMAAAVSSLDVTMKLFAASLVKTAKPLAEYVRLSLYLKDGVVRK